MPRRHELAERRKLLGMSQERLAEVLDVDRSTVARWERGEVDPLAWHRPALAKALEISVEELALLLSPGEPPPAAGDGAADDEVEALELTRRVEASDVSAETLNRLEAAFDEMAIAYTTARPEELIARLRLHLRYVSQLMEARKTIRQHRQLLLVGGWLSLLAATVHIDLRESGKANAWLRTAYQLATHAAYPEIQAWCLETQAWDELTAGRHKSALELSLRAQAIAPRESSARIQSIAQEGRAWARMRQRTEALDAVERVQALVSGMDTPDRPEHHYRYDPGKALSYTATTLAWAGDPAAEGYARAVVQRLEQQAAQRPRRLTAAQLDLGLALVEAGKPDEAAVVGIAAITSGLVVPSNWWRATEVLRGVALSGIGEVTDLRDAYESYRPCD